METKQEFLTNIGPIDEARQIDDEEDRCDEDIELCQDPAFVFGINMKFFHRNRVSLSSRLGACPVVARHGNLLRLKIVRSHGGKSFDGSMNRETSQKVQAINSC